MPGAESKDLLVRDEDVQVRHGFDSVTHANDPSPATCSPPTWSASSDPSLSALIPLAYQLVSVASIAAFARTKRYRFCRASQLTMMLLRPFLLQWSLGGFGQSSAVALWALMAALGALVFLDCAGLSPG